MTCYMCSSTIPLSICLFAAFYFALLELLPACKPEAIDQGIDIREGQKSFQVLLEIDIPLLIGKLLFDIIQGRNTFIKIVGCIWKEGGIRLEVDKTIFCICNIHIFLDFSVTAHLVMIFHLFPISKGSVYFKVKTLIEAATEKSAEGPKK